MTDGLLRRAAAEPNTVERFSLYREIERYVLAQAPIVPLYHTRGVIAMHDYVRGLEPGPLGLAKVDLGRVWFSRPTTDRHDVRSAGG